MKLLHLLLSLAIIATSTTALAGGLAVPDAEQQRMAHTADAGHGCCDEPEQASDMDCCDSPTCGECSVFTWAFFAGVPKASTITADPAPLTVGSAVQNPLFSPLLRPPIA